jgi:hypothetical protein
VMQSPVSSISKYTLRLSYHWDWTEWCSPFSASSHPQCPWGSKPLLSQNVPTERSLQNYFCQRFPSKDIFTLCNFSFLKLWRWKHLLRKRFSKCWVLLLRSLQVLTILDTTN